MSAPTCSSTTPTFPARICNPAIRAGFGTKLAWVAERGQDVIIVGRDDEDSIHAAHLAAAVGIANLGYLAGGMTSWREDKRPTTSTERLDVEALRDRSRSGSGARRPRARRVGRRPSPGLRASFPTTTSTGSLTGSIPAGPWP